MVPVARQPLEPIQTSSIGTAMTVTTISTYGAHISARSYEGVPSAHVSNMNQSKRKNSPSDRRAHQIVQFISNRPFSVVRPMHARRMSEPTHAEHKGSPKKNLPVSVPSRCLTVMLIGVILSVYRLTPTLCHYIKADAIQCQM